MLPKFFYQEVEDVYIRENFKKVSDFIVLQQLLSANFVHLDFTVPSAKTDYAVPHGLGSIPTDVITTFISTGTATWDYAKFDRTYLYITTSAGCRVRAFVGNYQAPGGTQ